MTPFLPIEFVIRGTPVSLQAKGKGNLKAWKARVEQSARAAWPAGEPPLTGEVTIVITYFYRGRTPDVDNIVKPVQDALSSIVYDDDEQVTQLIVRKNPVTGRFDLTSASPQLVVELNRGQDFLLVR